MYLKIKLVKDFGLLGKDEKTGNVYIINTGLSFTGVTEDGKKCSIINPLRVEYLKSAIDKMIVIHGNEVLDNNVLIMPDKKWDVSITK
ncbi:hypothetical protein [Serratia proteamaculans]